MTNQIISQILIYLTDLAGFIKKSMGGVGLSGVHYGWLIVFFFVFVILIVALSLGRSRMLLAILSLYVAAFLEPHFIYFDRLREAMKSVPAYGLHLGLFLLIYLIAFGIINRSMLKHRMTLAESSVFTLIFIAIAEAGFLAAIVISYLPDELLKGIPGRLLAYFGTKNALFWWALLPILLFILSKKKKESVSSGL